MRELGDPVADAPVAAALDRGGAATPGRARLAALPTDVGIGRPFGREPLTSLFRFERGGERVPFDIPDHLAAPGTFWRDSGIRVA